MLLPGGGKDERIKGGWGTEEGRLVRIYGRLERLDMHLQSFRSGSVRFGSVEGRYYGKIERETVLHPSARRRLDFHKSRIHPLER